MFVLLFLLVFATKDGCYCQTIFGSFPDELMQDKGGLTHDMKLYLIGVNYSQYIYVTDEVARKYEITPSNIKQFTICDHQIIVKNESGNFQTFKYFMCPNAIMDGREFGLYTIYCCLETSNPRCCNKDDFKIFYKTKRILEEGGVSSWKIIIIMVALLILCMLVGVLFFCIMVRDKKVWRTKSKDTSEDDPYLSPKNSGYNYGKKNGYGRTSVRLSNPEMEQPKTFMQMFHNLVGAK